MDIGKKQQIMVDWFRKTLDESKKPWNTQVYLITDKYHVYIANKDIRLIGSNFGKAIDRPLKYFLFTDSKYPQKYLILPSVTHFHSYFVIDLITSRISSTLFDTSP